MYWWYSALLGLGLLLSLPYWLFQWMRSGKYRAGLGERLGRVPARLLKDSRPAIWFHAVSVGEVLAVADLVASLQRRFPQYRAEISTTTETGQRLARKRFGEENVFYFPLDLPSSIRPYLQRLRPVLLVMAETEFWPNMFRLARASGARVAVVNARISDRSFPGYRRWRRVLARMLSPVDLFLAQTEQDRRRLIEIGATAERVRVAGNLKFDAPLPSPPAIVAQLRQSLHESAASPVFVCGSTADEQEEGILLRSFENVLASYPQATMILAPRHPERFEEVARLLTKMNIRFWRRSQWNGESLAAGVLLLDTIGELASIYALADVAFVGGSLVPRGGHNILEPAQHGVAVVTGHRYENFREMVNFFQSRNAARVAGPAEVPLVFMELAARPEERQAMGRRGFETAQLQKGATARTQQALEALLEASAAREFESVGPIGQTRA